MCWRLRELHVNQHFLGERSVEIVVRVADHRRELAARRRRTMYWDEALTSFAEGLGRANAARTWREGAY